MTNAAKARYTTTHPLARHAIQTAYGWYRRLAAYTSTKSYYSIPGRGVSGWRSPVERSRHLQPVLASVRGKSVLDIGCAEGCLTSLVAQAGARSVVGMDVKEHRIADARRLFGSPNLRFEQGDINNFPKASARAGLDQQYDVILLLSVYHFLRPNVRQELLGQLERIAGERIVVRVGSRLLAREVTDILLSRAFENGRPLIRKGDRKAMMFVREAVEYRLTGAERPPRVALAYGPVSRRAPGPVEPASRSMRDERALA